MRAAPSLRRRHGECPHCFALLPRAPLAFHRGFLPVQSGLRHRFGGGTSDIAHTGAGRLSEVWSCNGCNGYPRISRNIPEYPVPRVVCYYALCAFLPSVPSRARHTHLLIKTSPASDLRVTRIQSTSISRPWGLRVPILEFPWGIRRVGNKAVLVTSVSALGHVVVHRSSASLKGAPL